MSMSLASSIFVIKFWQLDMLTCFPPNVSGSRPWYGLAVMVFMSPKGAEEDGSFDFKLPRQGLYVSSSTDYT
jgi:hypothetical protein